MAYRNKEEVLRQAERLGLDIADLPWAEQQKAVADAMKAEELGLLKKEKKLSPEEEALLPYMDKTVFIAPEMAADANRVVRYMEEIGDDLDVEEKRFTAGGDNKYGYSGYQDLSTGTFRVKGKTGRKVVAECSLPKENAQIVFRPGVDMFPVVTYRGKSGYLYKHHKFPNFKDVLVQSGYYEDYKDKLASGHNTFYLTGLLCVEPSVAHWIMHDIEERVADLRRRGGSKWRR